MKERLLGKELLQARERLQGKVRQQQELDLEKDLEPVPVLVLQLVQPSFLVPSTY